MALIDDLITIFRKENEDLVQAMIIEIFLMKHGEYEALTAGEHSIPFEGQAYDNDDDYIVGLYQAVDDEGVDVRGEISWPVMTSTGFTINVARPCSIKWVSARKIPKINFWTD